MSGLTRPSAPGELAIVLHTHMPYVEGFGTWPFGEEWLWEAIVTSYLPLLGVLERAAITLSLTPVLCDQLEAPGALERCVRFLREIRPESHLRDVRELRPQGDTRLVAELERSAAEYAAAADALEGAHRDLLASLGRFARWTSAATHAVLPLLATDAGVSLQVETGIAAHRRRFGAWEGGFWLPECAWAPWLEDELEAAGVRACCVELTGLLGLGDARHLHPLRTAAGLVLWPVDRVVMELVWGPGGYPSRAAYRDYHRRTTHHHRVWRIDGAPYDREAALRQAAADARDFVRRVRDRIARGGVCVCALDTELLGHWWYEGVDWLAAVIEEAYRQEVPLTTLEQARVRHEPTGSAAELPVTSWGEGGDLRTWSWPAVADLAFGARSAELRTLRGGSRPNLRALRELLALQSSDWAFLAWRGTAGPYPRERAAGHAQALAAALAGAPGEGEVGLRNLAPDLAP